MLVGKSQRIKGPGLGSAVTDFPIDRQCLLKGSKSLRQLAATHPEHPQVVERSRLRIAIPKISAKLQGALTQGNSSVGISVHEVAEAEVGEVCDLLFHNPQPLGSSQPLLTPTNLLHSIEPLFQPVACYTRKLAAHGGRGVVRRGVLGTP